MKFFIAHLSFIAAILFIALNPESTTSPIFIQFAYIKSALAVCFGVLMLILDAVTSKK